MLAAAVGGAVAACAPPLPLVVLPPDGVSTLSVCARPRPAETAGRGPHRLCPLTAPAAPASQMAASAGGKSLRARCGVPLRPPVPAGRRRPWPAAGASSVVSRPCPVRAAVGRLRSRRPRRRPRPRRSARATKVGGLAPAAFGRRAAAAARPSAPAPPPGFGPGAGLFCFRCGGFGDCAACGRRLPNQVRCTWLRHPRHASCDAGTTYSVFLNQIALHLDELQVSC